MSGWIYNQWYCAMYSELLPAGAVEARVVLEESIVLWRGQDGAVHAIEDRCPHRWAPLSIGKQVGVDRIRCKYHGLEFDGTGHCVHNPHGKGRIPESETLRRYQVHEYCGIIWLWMGWEEPDLALLPDLSNYLPGSPHHVSKPGWIAVDVPFELMIDNVLDLSHVALVHEGILGNEESLIAETSFEQRGKDGVFAHRFTRDIRAPEYFDLIYKADGRRLDIWNDASWKAPSHLMLEVGCTNVGGNRSDGTAILAHHVLTPVTKTSCMYHYLGAQWNPPQRSAERNAAVEKRLAELRKLAFSEQDGPIIAAQFKVIQRIGEFRPLPLPGIDQAAVMWRRLYDRILKEEQARRPLRHVQAQIVPA
jgi:vanillate O-demethylase monooxygenase subunit